MSELPKGWEAPGLAEICDFNPKHDPDTDREQLVSFVPMPAVSEETGTIVTPQDRPLSEIWKGYTHFQNGDVIFAKITPCMENGKSAVAVDLTNGLACGSTEFHVLRPRGGVLPDYIWKFVRQVGFRKDAEAHMTGAVGQRRVPKPYLEKHQIPLPPLPEQRRIVSKHDILSARTATARTHLSAIAKLVERYKASALIKIFQDASKPESTTTLDRVGRLICGQSPTTVTVNKEGIGTPYCTGPEQWDGQTVHLDKWTTDPKRTVNEPSIFITVKGSGVGTLFPGAECAIGRDVYAYVPDQSQLDEGYAYWALRYEIANILLNAKGLIPGLSKPDILDNSVYVPSLAEQRKLVAGIDRAFAKIDRLAAEAEKALKLTDRLDQRILAKAFAGELVPQDLNDEPASVLLDRIRAEQASAP